MSPYFLVRAILLAGLVLLPAAGARAHNFTLTDVQLKLHDDGTYTVDVVCDPGDVVLFSNMLFHCGQPNVTSTVRWSLDWRYQDASQSTLRRQHGHLARSRTHPDRVVRDGEHWANLMFS